ncbi:aldo/keto reductase [Desulfonatronum parangueonense]
MFSLGGESALERRGNQYEAVALIDRALDLGVNYIDTAPTYGAGGSEANIGKVMARRRSEVFLASKTHDRGYDGTMRLVEQSLERLQTDYLDLYQIHNVRIMDDVDMALGKQGALRAMERLRSEKVIRHIGITGHRDPEVLLHALGLYDFDAVLLSLNAGDIHFKPFQKDLLRKAEEKQMGIIAMKVTAVNRIFRSDGLNSMREALGYVLSFPVSTAIVGISNLEQLEENVRIAKEFEPFSRQEMASIESKVQPYHDDANFFKHYW